MKYNKNGSLPVELAIVIFILAGLASLAILAFTKVRESATERAFGKNTYQTWVKLTGRTDFSYEEWVEARKAGLITVPVVNYSNNKNKIENE